MKDVQDLYNENHKTLLKNMKINVSKQKDIPFS